MLQNWLIRLKHPAVWGWSLLFIGFACLYWHVLKPDLTGFLYDDGMYLMAGKALVSGQGYRLSGIAGAPLFYKYPPLYPLLLGLVWKLYPQFPQDIPLLKSVNILLGLITLGLWGYYFRKVRGFSLWICLGLVAILGLNSRFTEYSTELMSEPLYMALTAGALCLCHKYTQKGKRIQPNQLAFIILLSIGAFYTRTLGATLITGIALWLWLTQPRTQAIIYSISSGLLALPWLWWSGSRKDTTYAVGDFLIRTFQETYFQSLKMDLTYEYTLPKMIGKGWQELLGNFSVQCFPLLERLFLQKATLLSEGLILGLSFALLLPLGHFALQQLKTRRFSPEGFYACLYLLILPCWSFYKFYPRFIVPMLPLIWAAGIGWIQSRPWRPRSRHAVTVGLVGIAMATTLIHAWPYWQKPFRNTLAINAPIDLWQEYEATYRFIKIHTPKSAILYAENNDELYLHAFYSERKVLDFLVFLPPSKMKALCPSADKSCLKILFLKNAGVSLALLKQNKVQYILEQQVQVTKNKYNSWLTVQKAQQIVPLIIQQQPNAFQIIFTSPLGLFTLYQYYPEKSQ